MLVERHGNLLNDEADILTVTVNMRGAMGAGLAKQFATTYGNDLVTKYRQAIHDQRLTLGKPTCVCTSDHRLICLFPTKDDWRQPSQLDWIDAGLAHLAHCLDAKAITSIAMPPLGCGLGGLTWHQVRPLFVEHLGNLRTRVHLYT